MWKMPAKKKSCFQITSVTQAQVAAVGATDDTESLEDPDESRTEDVSSEMYEPMCDRNSSEEGLNNTGEPEATGVIAPSQLHHFSLLSVNPLGEVRKAPVSGPVQQPAGIGCTAVLPLVTQQQAAPTSSSGLVIMSVNVSQPATVPSPGPPPPAATTVTCTSRFRVIKLDHGTGEPFRRGRWMCTEFYEKESDGSIANRTVDVTRRDISATPETAADRDSAVGHTTGSVVAPAPHSTQASGASPDVTRMHPAETSAQQNFTTRQHAVSGSGPQIVLTGSKPTSVPVQPVVVSIQPAAPQSVGNGLPHMQKSPILPPSGQTQAYQLSMGHHLTGLNQTEYYEQQPGIATGQSLSVSGQSAGAQTMGQATSPAMPQGSTGVSMPVHFGDVAGVGAVLPGQTAPSQTGGMGSVAGSILVSGSTHGQYATTGQPKPQALHPASSGVQNVPVTAANSGMPPTVPIVVPSASSTAVPKVTAASLTPGQMTQGKTPGALAGHSLLVAGFGQVEGVPVRKSDGVVNAQSFGKDLVKPLMPESLQLATPTVNSLFGIHIPVDGDEDRNPSKAFYQAFQSGTRLRDSKAHSDSASGTNIVAIDNKIEQAMDLVKSHLMYAVREEVEVLKEQIKELFERNSLLERENAVLKSLANSEQLSQLPAQSAGGSAGPTPPLPQPSQPPQQLAAGLPPQVQPLLQQQQQHPKAPQTHPQLDASQQQPNVTSA
ncbi:TSC22 domain family protein 2-like isoform X1 [Phycodurus eques]|uniref:TSC22 domain family protein 2-like isoform X1 n=1 Tax=Phycodurus eques TaxID=693459 RepID=UPI002ACD6FE8|nr:TSC22 domain family protein 2-like isoform X1 [Phycodurus eques]